MNLPGWNLRPLKGKDHKGHFSVWVNGNWRAAEPMLPKGKVIKEKSLLVRKAVARMQVAPRAFNQEEWNALASHDGSVVSGDPKGPVSGNLKADDNE
jgi:plasmid maintenance system killer protein